MRLSELMVQIADCTGGATDVRTERTIKLYEALPIKFRRLMRVVECHDEHTGERYGRAACRRGRCAKIGGGGRHKGSTYAYQVWLDWS